ncbi:hypothetical protein HS048_04770 [Planomonospora sp. ID91781]|uniref:hypothetical protein n=1 Tax=Planomonospora sp. ID91781 TaxID=2738135 RepID=UPI0018C42A1F|nr:hypothetical protein [Planomonospora sp. ID91781]MBG0820050.1 hypothetical protein [Planomonospora sp. ID91781]
MTETPSVPPGTGPLAPEFSGIDPALMNGFITELERAGQVIAEQAENIRRELAAVDLPAAGLAPIREIGGWAEQQVPRLRQRVATITAPGPEIPGMIGTGLRPYQEASLLSPAEARRQGTELGERFAAIDPDEFRFAGPYASERIAAVFEELKAHRHDAGFTAAFFAALGPAGIRRVNAALRRLPDDGRPDALRTAGTAFATAVGGGAKTPGFAAVMKAAEKAMTGSAGDTEDVEAVAALLSHGDYPDAWLAGLAAPALRSGSRIGGSALAGVLNALGNNPAAARLAIGSAARFGADPAPPTVALPFGRLPGSPEKWDDRPELAAFLKDLNERTMGIPETAGAFGRLLAAASGAYDEQDGRHSQEAGFFAYTVMTTADGWRLNDATRIHLAEIAGSYATEITLGADLGDSDVAKGSAMQTTPGLFEWTPPPGLRGAFRLSPEDTFRFMTTFAGTPETRSPFDDGMDKLLHRMLPHASEMARSSGDVTALDNLFAALGNVRGFELAAAVRVLKPNDDGVEDAEDAESFLAGGTLGVLGLINPFSTIPRAWTALSTGVSAYYTYGRDPKMQVEEIQKLDGAETLARPYEAARLLMAQGFTPKVDPSGSIVGPDGALRPFNEIAKQGKAGLQALDQWFVDNGMGRGDKFSFGQLSRRETQYFEGAKQPAFERARLYTDKLMTD